VFHRVSGVVIAAADGTSQRRYSQSPSSRSRRHSGAPGEIWLAWSSAARRCRSPADADAQVYPIRRLAGEVLAGLGREPGGDGLGQHPGQHRQPGLPSGQHCGARGGLMVRVPDYPGVVEDEQAAGVGVGGGVCDVAC